MGGLTGFDRGQDEGPESHVGSSHHPPWVFVAESALSPSSSQIIIHSLPSNTSYVDKSVSFAPPSFSFLFLHHRLGRRSSPAVPSLGQSPPQFPYPSLATILKHLSCPLLASLTVSGLQRKSDKRYNRVCLFLQRHHSISCQVARLTLLVVHWSHPDSSTPLSNFLVSLSSLQ